MLLKLVFFKVFKAIAQKYQNLLALKNLFSFFLATN